MSTLRSFIKQVILETSRLEAFKQNLNEEDGPPERIAPIPTVMVPILRSTMSDAQDIPKPSDADAFVIESMDQVLNEQRAQLIADVDAILSPFNAPVEEPGGGTFVTSSEETENVRTIIRALEKDLQIAELSLGSSMTYIYPYRTALTVIALERGEVYAGETFRETLEGVYRLAKTIPDLPDVFLKSRGEPGEKQQESFRRMLQLALLTESATAGFFASVAAKISGARLGAGITASKFFEEAVLTTLRNDFLKDTATFRAFLTDIFSTAERSVASGTLGNAAEALKSKYSDFVKGFPSLKLKQMMQEVDRGLIALRETIPALNNSDAAYDTVRGFLLQITDIQQAAFPATREEALTKFRKYVATLPRDNPMRQVLDIANQKTLQTPSASPTDIQSAEDLLKEMADVSYDLVTALRGQLPMPSLARSVAVYSVERVVLAGVVTAALWGSLYTGLVDPDMELTAEQAVTYLHHMAIVKIAQASMDKMLSDSPTFAPWSDFPKRNDADALLKELLARKSTENLKSSEIQPVIDAYKLALNPPILPGTF